MQLQQCLENANAELDRLIRLTNDDIEDIKAAKHEAMFARIAEKEDAIAAFERWKGEIDRQILSRAQEDPRQDLETLLGSEEQAGLAQLRTSLEALHAVNRRFAKLVITVGEFYNSLMEEMLPTEQDGYLSKNLKTAALMEIRA